MGQLVPQPPVQDYTMAVNAKMNSASVIKDFEKMQALSIDPNGTLYNGGNFTFDMSSDHIAKWDGSAWEAICSENSIHEPAPTADICGFCGVGIQDADTCPRCGAPPVRKREYKRGKFIVKLYQPGVWDRLRDVVKL